MKNIKFLIEFICLLSQVSFSQPTFTSYGEIKVSQSPAVDSPLSIAVNKDGAVWVVWGNTSQWLYPNLDRDGDNVIASHIGYLPISLSNGKWAKITERNTKIKESFNKWRNGMAYYFRFWINDHGKETDSSANIFDTHWCRNFITIPTPDDVQYAYNIRGYILDSIAYVAWNTIRQFRYDDSISGGNQSIMCGITFWNPFTKQNAYMTKTGYGLDYDTDLEFYGIQNHVVSRPFDHKFVYYARLYEGNSTLPRFLRTSRVYNNKGNPINATITIDTIQASQTNTSERVILRKDQIILMQRNVIGNGLKIEKFDFNGLPLSAPKNLQIYLRDYPSFGASTGRFLDAEYDVYDYGNDRIVIVWTNIENANTDIYIGILDDNFDFVSSPKRINSDTTGNQYSPSIALKGDTVYVAWIDTRDGSRQVYMRRFKADQITDVKNEESQPKQFAIQEIYPNPFRESTTIKFTLSQNWERVGVRVFDLLGRLVKTLFEGEAESGMHTVQFNAEQLPSGVYQVVLQSGKNVERKNVVVMR